MRHLLLMRHAKSDWGDSSLKDHDRPLNDRGLRDAPRMGDQLEFAQLVPDLIVSSTARRAQETAELVARNCGYAGEILLRPDLYHAEPREWETAVGELPPQAHRVLMVGHNPGIERFQWQLSRQHESFPTATIAVLELDAGSWEEFRDLGMSLQDIWRPKEL